MPLAIGSYTYDFCPSVSSVSSSTYPKKQFVTKKSVNKTKVPDFTVTRRLGGYVSIDLKHTNLVLDVFHNGNSLGKLLKFYLKRGVFCDCHPLEDPPPLRRRRGNFVHSLVYFWYTFWN